MTRSELLSKELDKLPTPYAPLTLTTGKNPKYIIYNIQTGERVASGNTLSETRSSINKFLSV
jgi:hypothetical protein